MKTLSRPRRRGTRFRIPRKSKKALSAAFAGTATEHQMVLVSRMTVWRGWKRVRKVGTHVAMGSTTSLRLQERNHRAYLRNL